MKKILIILPVALFLFPVILAAKPDSVPKPTPKPKQEAGSVAPQGEDPIGDLIKKDTTTGKNPEGAKVVDGGLEYVACFSSGNLSVRNETLDKVLFKISPNDSVKLFQGWGENKKKKTVSGKEYDFVRAQFPDEEEGDPDEGWLPEDFIKLKSECASALKEEAEEKLRDDAEASRDVDINGLNDPNCCEFPLSKYTNSFMGGMAEFGHKRGKGRRLHAACDLYQTRNAPISSVAGGTIIRSLYKFYQGTWAVEVKHQGGFVVRYGEMTGKSVKGQKNNKKVTRGQLVGYMGKVNSNCCEPMLHFELYSGKKKGSLSGNGKYKRRSDLINPTKDLLKWRKEKFRD
jgi:murein DD-endopeptidase MepM/ murein hydrolase activator NlpD